MPLSPYSLSLAVDCMATLCAFSCIGSLGPNGTLVKAPPCNRACLSRGSIRAVKPLALGISLLMSNVQLCHIVYGRVDAAVSGNIAHQQVAKMCAHVSGMDVMS